MAKDLFDKVRNNTLTLAGRGKSKENYACKGCVYLNEERGRCRKWGGRCGPDDQACAFYITEGQYAARNITNKRKRAEKSNGGRR